MKEMTTEIAEKNGVVAAQCCQHCSHYSPTAPCKGDCSKLECWTFATDVCNHYHGNNEEPETVEDGTAHDMNGKTIYTGARVEYDGCEFDVDEISDSRHIFLLDDYSNSIEADPRKCKMIE